jgi:uncharacterized protein (TIGR02145 family)
MGFYYGAMYNWHAVNTGKLALANWRVPNDDDWAALSDFLGGDNATGAHDEAGGKLKAVGTEEWASPNTGATDIYRFAGLPGGSRSSSNGTFGLKGTRSHWRSSTESGATTSYYYAITYDSSSLIKWNGLKGNGFAVRLMRDTDPRTPYIQDFDGNWYGIIKIGNQWWINRDFRCTHYNDGTEIQNAVSNADWSTFGGQNVGLYCWYNNIVPNNMPVPLWTDSGSEPLFLNKGIMKNSTYKMIRNENYGNPEGNVVDNSAGEDLTTVSKSYQMGQKGGNVGFNNRLTGPLYTDGN